MNRSIAAWADRIGERSEPFVRAAVGRDDHRSAALALGEDLVHVTALYRVHRVEAEIVGDKHVDSEQLAQLGLVRVVETCVLEPLEELVDAHGEHGVLVPARDVAEGVREEGLAYRDGTLGRWGDHFIDKIAVPEIDAWVRSLRANYAPETIRHHVGLCRRIVGTARGQYQLPPIDWELITLPVVNNEHALNNRLSAEQIAVALPIVVEQYPFYAPMIFSLYTLGFRCCHVAAMRESKLSADGVIAIDEWHDVSASVFRAVDQRKKAPPMIALEPRTLELVRRHRAI